MSRRVQSPPQERIGSLYGAAIEPKPNVTIERQVADVGAKALSIMKNFDTFAVRINASPVGENSYMMTYLKPYKKRFAVSIRVERLQLATEIEPFLDTLAKQLIQGPLSGPKWNDNPMYSRLNNCYHRELAGGITTILSTGPDAPPGMPSVDELYEAVFGADSSKPFLFQSNKYKWVKNGDAVLLSLA